MTGDRLIFYIALGAAIAMIVLIVTGCADRDMSRRETNNIVELEKAVRRCPGEPVCKGWKQ